MPSRLVTLAGPELLLGGLTALERRIVQEREIDWQTYGLAAVDLAAIASGVALLRFAGTAARGARAGRAAGGAVTLGSGARAVAGVLGINAVRYGVPAGLARAAGAAPGRLHPRRSGCWRRAWACPASSARSSAGAWSLLPLSFLLTWLLLSVRLLRLAGWLLGRAARGCQRLALRLSGTDRADPRQG